MNTKTKILASVALGATALFGGFGTASATSPELDEPKLPPRTITMEKSGAEYYIRTISEVTGGGSNIVCGPYRDDPSRTVLLCLNADTRTGFAAAINSEKFTGESYHFEKGTRLESEDVADLRLKENKSLKDQNSSLNSQCRALAAVIITLLLIIASLVYMVRDLSKKNKILEKKAKAYDQLQEIAKGLNTHYPLNSGE